MHSFHAIYMHAVFSTKNREPCLTSKIRDRLWPYPGGIARENGTRALAVSKVLQLLKGNSSKRMHATFPELHRFSWQIFRP